MFFALDRLNVRHGFICRDYDWYIWTQIPVKVQPSGERVGLGRGVDSPSFDSTLGVSLDY